MHKNFERHFIELFGTEYNSFVSALGQKARTSVRLSQVKSAEIQWEGSEDIPWQKDSFWLKERPAFYADPLHHAGAYYVQESSSMFFPNAIDFSKPLRVLDLCAAPGGKSTLLLNHLHPESLLVSNELSFERNKVLVENLNRWGSANVAVTNNKADAFAAFNGQFDVVLIDAPCSGEGMFRKDRESLEQWSPNFVESCAAVQKDILSSAAPLLRSGGMLIYSTCTFEKEENEKQIQRLLAQSQAGEWESREIEYNYENGPERGSFRFNEETYPFYHFYLHKTLGEGQFVCALQKTGEALMRETRGIKSKWNELNKREIEQVSAIMPIPDSHILVKKEPWVYAIPKIHAEFLAKLDERLNLWKLGIRIGEIKGRNFKPDHQWAQSEWAFKHASLKIELSYEEAIKYLKREVLHIPKAPKSWLLPSYRGFPLGWGKNLGQRMNNYFPKELVLRKTL